ncbi:MAG: hypothetical protein AAFV88_15210 [Planctomycetota bacterium]
MSRVVLTLLLLGLLATQPSTHAEESDSAVPDNFRRENLVAWCIVPFDAKQRGPEQRAQMLADLGLKRCAYDWRKNHVPSFEQEIDAYDRHGIEYVAFWGQHPKAFELFTRRDMNPDLWIMFASPSVDGQAEKVAAAVNGLMPLVKQSGAMGCRLGLYNHGGWSGEPANMIAVCKAIEAKGYDHVGIVYNFHHAHDRIKSFETDFNTMLPHLQCVNLNGMVNMNGLPPGERKRLKIRPIGSGEFEREMIQIVIDSGYTGPIGILGHVADRDVAVVLKENLEGLNELLGNLKLSPTRPAESNR